MVCELSGTRVLPWSQEPEVLTGRARHQLWPRSGHAGDQRPPPACPTPTCIQVSVLLVHSAWCSPLWLWE